MRIPAICDNCGTVFPSGFEMEGGYGTFVGCSSGPCPNCQGTGSIPDGLYEFVGETLNIVTSWPLERIQSLAAELERARRAPDPRAAAEAVIAENTDLLDVANKLLIPRDAGQFWGFIAALLALLALLSANQSDRNITLDVETVIEQACQPAPPSTEPPEAPVRRRDT